MQLSKKFLATVLVVVGLATYALSFGNGLFWDDDDFILHNQYIQDTKYFPKLFSENVIAGSGLVSNYWRPVLLLVFSAEWHAWGDWAPGWHMVNALFHVANGVLLFWIVLQVLSVIERSSLEGRGNLVSTKQLNNITIKQKYEIATSQTPPTSPRLRRTGRNDKDNRSYTTYRTYIAFFVAIVFLLHPVQVEAVAYANSLGDSLSVFFMFLGVVCFQRTLSAPQTGHLPQLGRIPSIKGGGLGRGWWLSASVLCYALALMSKETAIVLPGLLALVLVFHNRAYKSYRSYKTYGIQLLPFVVTMIGYLLLRATTLNFKNSFNLYDQSNAFTDSLWVRLLTFCKIIVEYFKLIFWPEHLHMERSLAFATSILDMQVILGGIICFGLLIIAWWFWRKEDLVSIGVLWFFMALVPTSNILVPINGLLYEHWLYLPVVGVAIALVGLVSYLHELFRSDRSYWTHRTPVPETSFGTGQAYTTYVIPAIGIVIAMGMMVRTVVRIQDWRDSVAFYKQTLQYAPHSYRILNNLGMVLADRGDLRESIDYYKQAIEQDTTNPVAYHNLANTYAGLGNLALATEIYEKALTQDPKFLYTYGKLIQVYANIGNFNAALEVLDRYEGQVGKTEELEQARAALLWQLNRGR